MLSERSTKAQGWPLTCEVPLGVIDKLLSKIGQRVFFEIKPPGQPVGSRVLGTRPRSIASNAGKKWRAEIGVRAYGDSTIAAAARSGM